MQALNQTTQLLARGEAPGAMIWLMALGFTFICLFMMVVILIQKPKGGGLSGAFGGGAGAGGADNFIGGGIGNVLTAVTVACFLIFLLLAGGMTLAINAGDEVPEEEDTEAVETNDGAGTTDGDPELPPVVLPPVEPEPETEGTDEPGSEGESETEGETEAEAEAEATEPEAGEPETIEGDADEATPVPAE
ncbi:MAG: preprotein translocase subunit SecG [Planctomycetota bacterium]